MIALGIGLSGLLIEPGSLHAQQRLSPSELFDQGLKQYADSKFIEAQKTFRRLDPLQLNRRQRLLMYETIQNIDRQLKGGADPTTTLDQAAKALNSGKLPRAMSLFKSVAQHPGATKSQKEQATSQMAQIKRRMNTQLTLARKNVDQADAFIRTGRYQAAERKLREVKESGLDLGWFENERIDRQLMIIADRIAAQKASNKQKQIRQPTPPLTPSIPVKPKTAQKDPETAQKNPDPQVSNEQQNKLAQARKLETAMQKQLVQQQQQLAQRERQLSQQEEAHRKLTRQLEAQKVHQQHEAVRRQQKELEKQLAQQQQDLALRERKLAEQEKARRELVQRLEAESEQARLAQIEAKREQARLAQIEAKREQARLAQIEADREQARLAQAQQQERAQRQKQLAAQELANRQLTQQRKATQERERRERQEQASQKQAQIEKQLAQKQQEIAQQERELAQQEQTHRELAQQRLEAKLKQSQQVQAQRQEEELNKRLQQQQRKLFEHQRELDQREKALKRSIEEAAAHTPAQPQSPSHTDTSHAPIIEPPIDLIVQARLLHAQEKLAEARNAHQSNQYFLAAKFYQEALKLDPDLQEAVNALALVQSRAGQSVAPQGALETEIQARTIRSNAAIAEFQELMSRAADLLNHETFAAARESVQQAKITLDLNQRYLPTTRYRSLRDNAVNLAAQIADAQRRVQDTQRRDLEIARNTEAQKRRDEALLAQRQETERLLRRAADLRREQKYKQSLELINQALFLDPNNVAAEAMKEMIQDSQLFVESRNRFRERNLTISQQSSENLDATIPFPDLLTYPPDWPQLTAARLGGADPNAAESEVNRRVTLKLKDSVPVDFDNNKLVNIIEYLRNTTGVNFFVNWAVLQSVGIGKDMPITLQLTNVPVRQALRLVLQQASGTNEQDPIAYSIIEGVVTISTERDLAKATDIRPYDIRDLLVQVPNFTDAPEFDINSALSNTNSGGSNSSEGGGGGGGGPFATSESTTEELTRAELIEQVIGLIQNTVGKQEDWEIQGGKGSIRELNGNLIVKTTPKNHRDIAQLLSQLRETRALQIAVEGRFLVVDQNFLDEVGIDLDIDFDVGGNAGGKFSPSGFNQDSIGIAGREDTALTPDAFSGGLRSFDLNVTYLDDIQVRFMVRATQASRRSITLTAPRLTLMNGQRAYVVVAEQVTFISDLEPIPDSGGFDPTLSVTQSGVILDVEATVSSDRRYVTMTVRPSVATLVRPIREIEQTVLLPISATDTDGNDILVPVTAFIEAPEISLTSVKTTVSVPDRGTLLIGGQRLVADTEVEAGVPILSKIPILNRLFTNTSTVKDERTLLILIKPTIIIQSEEEELNFPGLLQDPQQFGVGRRL